MTQRRKPLHVERGARHRRSSHPAGDDPRQEAVTLLRAAQRKLGGGPEEIDAAILKVRQALEYIEEHCGWHWPGLSKDKKQRTQHERWAWIRSALNDQANGAVHARQADRECAPCARGWRRGPSQPDD